MVMDIVRGEHISTPKGHISGKKITRTVNQITFILNPSSIHTNSRTAHLPTHHSSLAVFEDRCPPWCHDKSTSSSRYMFFGLWYRHPTPEHLSKGDENR